MRSLVLTPLAPPDPFRDVHGVYRRFRLFVRALAALGDVEIVHFGAVGANGFHDDHIVWGTSVRTLVVPLNARPRSQFESLTTLFRVKDRGDFRPYLGRAQRQAARDLLATKPDLVFAHRVPMAELVRLAGGTDAPLVLDIDDIEHDVRLRALRNATALRRKTALLAEIPALYLAERRAVTSALLSFVCSSTDRQKLVARGFRQAAIRIAPNALDLPLRRPALTRSPTVLFLGAYGHEPNRRAAERLIGTIWPLIRARSPTARLIVAGAQPERIRQFAERGHGVFFPGFVADLDELYASTRVVCCPMADGGGTRIKLIEAAGRGKPIVSTAMGAEGLAFTHGHSILLAETDEQLADATVHILHDETAAEALAEAAFAQACSLYQAANVEQRISATIASSLRARGTTAASPQGASLSREASCN
jgi:glycosyltransferase involved in cell wall biosynthesis